MNIAIIPARGGSKRIPKKNIKNFLGKPIISYSIELALSTNLFSRVIVSTDSNEIAKVAVKYGAETPFLRPKELSDDYVGTHEVVGHAIRWLEERGEKIEYACCIYPTAPLIEINDIINGFKIIERGKWDSVIAATNYSYPVQRSFTELPDGGLKMLFADTYKSRSQDLFKVYHDAGQFYWAKSNTWKNEPDNYNRNSTMIKIPNKRVQDIDTYQDWERAEIIYQILKKN